MGFFSRLFGGKKAQPPELEQPISHLAFVLLSEPKLPTAEVILSAFDEFRGESEVLTYEPDEESSDEEEDAGSALVLELEGIGMVMVALVPAPVPEGEADHAFDFSMSSFGEDASLGDHRAHLIVTLMGIDQVVSPLAGLTAFTSVIAAIAKAAPAVGVYMGNAGATHAAEFVTSIAGERHVNSRIMLWNGLSRSLESDGRMSFLSYGMAQLGLPNLYLIAAADKAGESLGTFFDLLTYVANRGEPIPEGDTVGSTEDEHIEVNYVPSPTNDGSTVWRVRL